jgi:hypothetical protein
MLCYMIYSLHIRNVDKHLVNAAKGDALMRNCTLREWVIEAMRSRLGNAGVAQRIEQAPSKSQVAGSTPAPSTKIIERAVTAGVERGHDTKTCRIYGCLMCKALKA